MVLADSYSPRLSMSETLRTRPFNPRMPSSSSRTIWLTTTERLHIWVRRPCGSGGAGGCGDGERDGALAGEESGRLSALGPQRLVAAPREDILLSLEASWRAWRHVSRGENGRSGRPTRRGPDRRPWDRRRRVPPRPGRLAHRHRAAKQVERLVRQESERAHPLAPPAPRARRGQLAAGDGRGRRPSCRHPPGRPAAARSLERRPLDEQVLEPRDWSGRGELQCARVREAGLGQRRRHGTSRRARLVTDGLAGVSFEQSPYTREWRAPR